MLNQSQLADVGGKAGKQGAGQKSRGLSRGLGRGIASRSPQHLISFYSSLRLPIRTGTSQFHAGAERHPLHSTQLDLILPRVKAEKTVIDACCPPDPTL